MASRSYDDAVNALNSLQSGFRAIEERRKAGMAIDLNTKADMEKWLERMSYSTRDLDRLNIVHVAGTKGKGTVCAYVDSILSFYRKSHGRPRKTGLFTSPHLISVRERIRINSNPITEAMFAKYFFEVWDLYEASARSLSLDPNEKPPYFRYLTLMSYYVFLNEGVDVAIYEVGIGGEYDSTNVVERPAATGISTLAIDHVPLLGNTVAEIAWHKAGILKKKSPAFTVAQIPAAMEVIQSRARERGLNIQIAPFHPALQNVKIKPDADIQRTNASLALALTEAVLERVDPTFSLSDNTLPREFIDGLEKLVWRGRFEIKNDGNIGWYLDGAHNAVSLEVTARWFVRETSGLRGKKILIFNQQGRTEAADLLEGFFKIIESENLSRFDHVIFCTNLTYSQKGYKSEFLNHMNDSTAVVGLTKQIFFSEKWKSLDPKACVLVVPSIEEALDYVKSLATGGETVRFQQAQVLVTGSLHLVGGVLAVLEDTVAL